MQQLYKFSALLGEAVAGVPAVLEKYSAFYKAQGGEIMDGLPRLALVKNDAHVSLGLE